MAALWTVEYVGGAIRVRRHRSQADAEAYRDAVLRGEQFEKSREYDLDYVFWTQADDEGHV